MGKSSTETILYYSGSQPNELDEQSLIAILKVSKYWQIESSIHWAVGRLEQLGLTSTHKLLLAKTYAIIHWVAPAICHLISAPLSEISQNDAASLDTRTYSIIAQAREAIEVERKKIGAVAPGLSLAPSLACTYAKHATCKDVWARFWWTKVAYQILHPTNPLQLSAVFDYVTGLATPEGLNPQCKEEFLGQVAETGALAVEEEIIGAAIAAIQQYFSSTSM